MSNWEYFLDISYFDKYAVREKTNPHLIENSIHVNTKEEAIFLTKSLNKLTRLKKEWMKDLSKEKKILEEIQDFISCQDIGYLSKSYFCGDLIQKRIEKIQSKISRNK